MRVGHVLFARMGIMPMSKIARCLNIRWEIQGSFYSVDQIWPVEDFDLHSVTVSKITRPRG